MARGPGVSVAKVDRGNGTRWRVRWREWVDEGGTRKRKSRERWLTSEAAAIELRSAVLRALEAGQVWEPEAREVVPEPSAASLDAVGRGWLQAKAARGLSDGTLRKYAGDLTRITDAIRALERIPSSKPIPASVLGKPLCHRLALRWREEKRSEATVYNTLRVLLDLWDHGYDDPDSYPGVPRAPRNRDAVLPRPPVYAAPPAPTLAECDACIRQIPSSAYVARGVAIVARYTGLRIAQVLALSFDDLDEDAGTLVVRTGKSRREKAAPRVLPVHPAMVADLRRLGLLGESGGSLLRRRADLRAATVHEQHHPNGTLRSAWEAATKAKEARVEVWSPPNRKQARPAHAFRAALQAHLVRGGVSSEVINAIVGHAGTVRTRHYAGDAERAEAMREAVAALPPIDWCAEAADNVVHFNVG